MIDKATLTNYINSNFVIDKEGGLAPDDNLLLSGIIDSLGVMQLVAYLQSESDIKVEPREITLKNFKTVN